MNKLILLTISLAVVLCGGEPSKAQAAPANSAVKKIAFEVTHWNGFTPQDEVFVLDPITAKPKRLVDGLMPVWSPTGEKLAFCTRTQSGFGQVEIINADGSGRILLTQ